MPSGPDPTTVQALQQIGGTPLFGAAGGDMSSGSGTTAGGLLFVAQSGNETLNASAATSNNVMIGGLDTAGHDVIVAGSGDDTLIAQLSATTLTGGSGSDLFSFVNGDGGSQAMIANFTSKDEVLLSGYGASAANTALQNASTSGGNTTLTLSDNTQITFVGVSSASVLQGHVFST